MSSENTNISIASIDNLQSILDGKQSLIQDNTLAISTIENLQSSLDAKEDVITTATNINLNTLNTVSGVSVGGNLSVGGIDLDTKISTATSGKQDTLTAGDNITIDANNVISSSGGGETTETVYSKVFYARLENDTSMSGTAINNYYNSIFDINPKTNSLLYTFTNNDTITILKSGNYKIEFSQHFENNSWLDRAVVRSTVKINGIEDIATGGQSACYLRYATFGRHGSNCGSHIYSLNANDTIQIQNNANKGQNSGYTSDFGGLINVMGSIILITYLD